MKTVMHKSDNPKMSVKLGKGYAMGGEVRPSAVQASQASRSSGSPTRSIARTKSEVEQGYNKSEYRNTPQAELESRPNIVKRSDASYDISSNSKPTGGGSGGAGGAGGTINNSSGGGGGGGGGGSGGSSGSTSVGNWNGGGAANEPDFGGIY